MDLHSLSLLLPHLLHDRLRLPALDALLRDISCKLSCDRNSSYHYRAILGATQMLSLPRLTGFSTTFFRLSSWLSQAHLWEKLCLTPSWGSAALWPITLQSGTCQRPRTTAWTSVSTWSCRQGIKRSGRPQRPATSSYGKCLTSLDLI